MKRRQSAGGHLFSVLTAYTLNGPTKRPILSRMLALSHRGMAAPLSTGSLVSCRLLSISDSVLSLNRPGRRGGCRISLRS